MPTGTCANNIFKKKITNMDFESFIFWSKFRFLGTALGRFSWCSFLYFRHQSTMVATKVKGAVSDLRQFLATESPWKIIRNTFFFILTNWICYWQIRFCTYYAFSLNQISYIREVWKYWPLKDRFWSVSQKFYRAAILWWSKNYQTFGRHFFREQLSKYSIVEFTAIFVYLQLSWSRR